MKIAIIGAGPVLKNWMDEKLKEAGLLVTETPSPKALHLADVIPLPDIPISGKENRRNKRKQKRKNQKR